ncbi:MAG TPA: CHAT domain-containing protein [Thermoanaerobaculia bacterium]
MSRWIAVGLAVLAVLVLAAWLGGAADVVEGVRVRSAVTDLLEHTPPSRLPRARFSALGLTRASVAPSADSTIDDAPAAAVLEKTRDSTTPEAVRAAAAASVIGGDTVSAVKRLEEATARHPDDALLWNDLAAARYEVAKPLSLLDALVAADQALRLDPNNADAQYNRGLILEALGMRGESVTSWTSVDPELPRAGAARIRQLVAQDPYSARRHSEVKYLAEWGKALRAGDAAAAEVQLRVARAIGESLRAHRGESLLHDAVAAIDIANARRRLLLAEAHVVYDEGRRKYAHDGPAAAESLLRAASALFAQGGSPMALSADSYTANTLIDRGRTDEGLALLGRVLPQARGASYRALTGEVLWALTLVELMRGGWEDSSVFAYEALAIFKVLGEDANAGAAEGLLAEMFDHLGMRDDAWTHRMRALRLLRTGGDANRMLLTMTAAERNAIRNEQWTLARSLVGVSAGMTSNRKATVVNSKATRAIVQARFGESDAAAKTLRDARAVAAQVDAKERAQLDAWLDVTEAMTVSSRNPERAVELLTRAVDYYMDAQQYGLLPGVHLQRGRVYAAMGDRERGWRDFAAGIDVVETQREQAASATYRAQTLDAAEDLVDDALAMLMADGSHELAFSYAERTRARSLLDLLGDDGNAAAVDHRIVQSLLPPDVLFVEFAVLRDQLVVFAMRNDSFRTFTTPVKTAELERRVDAFSRLIAERKPLVQVRREAAALYDLLLGPVAPMMAGARELVVVPDYVLQRVPLAGLWRDRWLIEDLAVTVAPSASVLVAASRAPAPSYAGLLVVGNPRSQAMASLPHADREAEAIAALYRPAHVLSGTNATKANFVAQAARADVIHFAGHGLAGEDAAPSLFFAGEGGRMYAQEIARLTLPRRPLVVVAACSTLRGHTAGLDGTRSIASAFLAAGASTVVGTLWDIDDEPSAFVVTRFHEALKRDGVSPSAALREAQLASLRSGGHPANWAPFVVFETRLGK